MFSQAAIKNQKFATEIRQKQRHKYFQSKRLNLQPLNFNPQYYNIMQSLKHPPTANHLQYINNYIFKNKEELKLKEEQQNIIMNYLMKHFLQMGKDNEHLGDMVSLFNNFVILEGFNKELIDNVSLNKIVNKLVYFLQNTNDDVGKLILCFLSVLIYLYEDQEIFVQLYNKKEQYGQRFGYNNQYYLQFLSELSKYYQVGEQIVEVLIQQKDFKNIGEKICLVIQFSLNKKQQFSDEMLLRLIKWAEANLQRHESSTFKYLNIRILNSIFSKTLSDFMYHNIINSTNLITELVKRLQFDSNQDNKVLCIFCLCQLIKFLPNDLLLTLLEQYDEILKVLVHSMTLYDNKIIIEVLKITIKIVLIDKPICWKAVQESSIDVELNWLTSHQKKQISNMAVSIKESCFRNDF